MQDSAYPQRAKSVLPRILRCDIRERRIERQHQQISPASGVTRRVVVIYKSLSAKPTERLTRRSMELCRETRGPIGEYDDDRLS